MKQIEIREGARRQHRCLAMFCALYCWQHDKKAVFVQKERFLAFLGLERLKEIRMDWVIEDGGAYFPFIFRREVKIENKDSIVFSRISEDKLLKNKDLAICLKPAIFSLVDYQSNLILDGGEEAVKIINSSFPYLNSTDNLYEFSILNTLSLLANGAVDPKTALAKA